MLALMMASYTDAYVFAAPKGGHVVSGSATFQQDGNLTIVTAGNRSIINYQSFNVGANEIVRFVQPGANSSVLNRVLSPNPTNIFGQIQANGNVIIANPYGVFFQNGSVLNVGSLYAGAGKISNSDFTAGRIHFTDLAGDVRNDGVIAADNRIALMGANVVNNGTLTSAQGMAMMVAGSEVYVGARNSNVFVQANGAAANAAAAAAGGSIANHGTVAAPRVLLGAGDLYSTAIVNTGLLQGRRIAVNAGANGSAAIGGRLDASSAAKTGKGGSIQVLGGNVALQSAALDASGANGGGSVRVGGDFHGGGALVRAATTSVDAGTTIKADTTGTRGDGGSVVVWSDQTTRYAGQISARGGSVSGNGGQAEISSGNALGFAGSADLSAPAGAIGTLLLDPHNITISNAGTATPIVGTPPTTTVAFANTPAADLTLSAASLGIALGTANIVLQANNDIEFQNNVTAATVLTGNGNLTLQAGRSILFDTGVALSLQGKLTATFNDGGALPANRDLLPAANPAPATFTMGTGSKITAPGGVAINGGTFGDTASAINANTGDITLQDITTTANNPLLPANPIPTSGGITISNNAAGVTGKGITVNGTLTTNGPAANTFNPNTAAGPVILAASGPVVVNGVAASGVATGAGGVLSLSGNAAAGGPAVRLLGTVAGGSLAVNAGTLGTGGAVTAGTGELDLNAQTVATTAAGGQIYNGATLLNSAAPGALTTLTANGGGAIVFNFTLASATATAQALSLNTAAAAGGTAGFIQFEGTVGAGIAPLSSLTTSAGSAVGLFGGAVTTSGTGGQNYGGAVVLAQPAAGMANSATTTLTAAGGGGIVFGSAVTASGAVAGQELSLITTAPAMGTAGAITFNGAVAGTTALNSFPLASLKTGIGSPVNINGGNVTTIGANGQNYAGPVVLNAAVAGTAPVAATTLTAANGGGIVFGSTLGGSAAMGAAPQALTLDTTATAPGAITFNGAVAAATTPVATANLNGLTTTGGGPVNVNGGAITTAGGGQTYGGPVILGSTAATPATTFADNNGGAIRFTGSLGGLAAGTPQTVAVATSTSQAAPAVPGIITFGGPVGPAAAPLGSLTAGNGTVRIQGGAVTTSGAQTYHGQVTLDSTAGDLRTTLTGTTLTLGTGVNVDGGGTNNLTLNFSSPVTVTGGTTAAGNAVTSNGFNNINNFVSQGSNGTALTGTFQTAGSQSYTTAVTLNADTTLTAGGAVGVTFNGAVNSATAGGESLTVNTDGTTTFAGAVGATNALNSLTTNSNLLTTGLTVFNVAGVAVATLDNGGTNGGSQTYNNAVQLQQDTTLQSTAAAGFTAGNIAFNGKVDSLNATPRALTLNTAGNEIFRGLVGDTRALLSLTTDGGTGTTQFRMDAGTATVTHGGVNAGSVTINDGVLFQVANSTSGDLPGSTTNHPSVETTGAQTYNAAELLGANTVLQGSTLTRGAGITGAGFDLTLDFNGLITLAGISGVRNFASVGTGTSAATQIGGAFGTTGFQYYGNPVTLVADANLVSGTAGGGNGNLTFNSTLQGPFALTLNPAGLAVFHGVVGGGTAGASANNLTSLTVNGNASLTGGGLITTSGAQNYTGSLGLAVATTLASTGGTITAGSLTGNNNDLRVIVAGSTFGTIGTGGNLRFTLGTGTAVFNGAVSAISLVTDGTGEVDLNGGPVTTSSGTLGQSYGGPVVLGVTAAGTLTTLTASNGGPITFVSRVGGRPAAPAQNLILNTAGLLTLGGPVGSVVTPLASLATTGTGAVDLNGGSVTTAGGGQSYNGPVVLGLAAGGLTTLLDTAGGAVAFLQTVNGNLAGAQALEVDTAGNETFAGLVGAARPLLNLSTDVNPAYRGGRVNFNAPGSSAAAPSVTTTGDQTYNDAVVLGADAFLVGGNLTLNSTFNGGGHDLTLTFGGSVTVSSAFANLNNFTSNGTGTTTIAGNFNTGGSQTYANATTLSANAILTGGGPITFTSTLNGGFTLAVNTPGATTFGGPVGNLAPLASLTTDAPGATAINGGGIATLGLQTYNDAVTLGADTLLTSTNTAGDGGAVTFASALDSNNPGLAFRLEIDTPGNEVFGGLVGNMAPLGGLVTDANPAARGGSAQFNVDAGTANAGRGGVNVVGGALTLNDAAVFNVANSTLDHPSVLTINNTSGGFGAQTYNGPVVLARDTVLSSDFSSPATTGGAVTFNGTVDSALLNAPQSLTVLAGVGQSVFAPGATVRAAGLNIGGAQVTFNQPVGGANPLNVLTIGANGSIAGFTPSVDINNGSVTTTLGQTYSVAVVLSADTTLTDLNSQPIHFLAAVNSDNVAARSLTLNTGGTATFDGLVGASQALRQLTVTAGTGTFFNGLVTSILPAAVNVGAGGVTINGPTTFNVPGVVPGLLGLYTVSTSGPQLYNGPVTLSGNTSLYGTAGGDITFKGTIDGAFGLSLATAGNEVFQGIVGGASPLTSLSTDAILSDKTGQAQFTMNVSGQLPGIAGVRVGAGGLNIGDGVLFAVTGSNLANPSVLTFHGGTQSYGNAALVGADTFLIGDAAGALPPSGAVYGGGGAIQFESTIAGTAAAPSLTIRTGSGPTIFGGSVSANTVDVSGALVTVGGNISGLDGLSIAPNGGVPGGTINLNAGTGTGYTVSTTAGQTYRSPVALNASTLLQDTGGPIVFNSTVDGAFVLDVFTPGAVVFNGVVGGQLALQGLHTRGGGITYLNGGSVTTASVGPTGAGQQLYDDAVILGVDTALTDQGPNPGLIRFGSTLDSALATAPSRLSLNAYNAVFGGAVGANTALHSLSVGGGGTTFLNGGSVATSEFQTYGSGQGTQVGTATTLNAGTDISFPTVLQGTAGVADSSLTLNAPGTVLFARPVGAPTPLTRLTVNAGSLLFNGGSITTTLGQFYNGAVLLGAAATLQSGGNGNIVFVNTLDGAFDLTVNTGGITVFGGKVGGVTALTSLTTDNQGQAGEATQFNMDAANASANAAGVNVAGQVTVNDGVLFNVAGSTPANPSVQTGGAQTYNGSAVLSRGTILTSTGGGTLTFNSLVDGGSSLTLNTAGDEAFNGIVGGTAALASLTTDAAGKVGGAARFNMSAAGNSPGVTVSGAVTVNDGVFFNANAGTPANPSVLSGGAQTYNGAAALVRDTLLTSGNGGALTFNSTLDGGGALTLNTAGDEVFNAVVGGTAALTSLTTNGGTARFNIDLSGTPGAPAGVQVNGAVTLNSAAAFSVAGSGSNRATVLSGGTQIYNGAVTLLQDTVLASNNAGDLLFNAPVDGSHLLMLNTGGQTVFNQTVGSTTALLQVITDGAGMTLLNGKSVVTTGAQSYGDAVQLGTGVALTSQNTAGDGGAITFAQKVDGPYALRLNTSGNIVLGGAIGESAPLLSLRTDGGGLMLLNARRITTTGFQTYNNAVRLGAGTTLTSLNTAANGGAITFNNTLDGAQALSVNTGNTTLFNGAVGGAAPLASLATDAGGTTIFAGGSVQTSGAQVYGDTVQLQTAATLTSTKGGVAFGGTLDGAFALTLDASGEARFGGLVGGTTPLVSVEVVNTAGTTVFGGGGVTTTGFQRYGNAATLGADTTLASGNTANDNGAITFGNTVDGARALTLNTSGQTVFNAPVGSRTPLLSLTTDAPGSTVFNAGTVQTTGAQTYNDPATLSAARSVFVSSGGTLTFNQAVDAAGSANALELDTPQGSIFNGNIGAGAPVSELLVNGAMTFAGENLITSGNQHYAGGFTANASTTGATRLVSNSGTLRFDEAVAGGGSLYLRGNRIAVQSDITSDGDLSLNTVNGALTPLLLLNGNNYTSRAGSVLFNTQGTTPNVADGSATIVLANTGTVTLRGANFTMGYLQKLFALGALDIEVGRGVATVGDVSARDSINIAAAEVDLLARPMGLPAAGGRPNDGLNFVADNSINFGAAQLRFVGAENPAANFVTTTGNIIIQRVGGVSLFRDPAVDSEFLTTADFRTENFELVSNPLQPVGGGSQALDTAAALSGALPDQKPIDLAVDITISASQMEELKKLGIHPRLAQRSERISNASKRELFAQLVDGQDPDNYGRLQPIKGGVSRLEPSDYVVVVDRMGEREVQSILSSFEGLYGKDKEKVPQIGGAYQTAFNDYTVEKQTADPAGFAPYLEANPGKHPAVNSATRGFDDLFGHIEHLGLTDKEVTKSEEHIASDLGVSGVSPEDMVKVINSLRKKLPPAQKAASVKAPPSAPVGNPAPRAATPAAAPIWKAESPGVQPAASPAPPNEAAPAASPRPGAESIPEISPIPEGNPNPDAPQPAPAMSPAPTRDVPTPGEPPHPEKKILPDTVRRQTKAPRQVADRPKTTREHRGHEVAGL